MRPYDMLLSTEGQALLGYLEPLLPGYIKELRQLCAIECPTAYKEGVDEAGAWVRAWAARRGWETRVWPDETVGDSIVVTVPGGAPTGPRILLAAHLDTVYPVGTAAARPMRIDGDLIIGPGAEDNKSGLLSALYALAALDDLKLLAPFAGITLMCGGDEETDMRSSRAVLSELAPACDLALVLEAGRENGDIVSARKGAGHWLLEVHGRQAHAGVEPHKGANAILTLAQQIVALHLLNGLRPGATLNVGVITGGTLANVVPDYARAEIDVRVLHPEDMAPVQAAIERIAGTPYAPGTTAELSGGFRAPPMASTPEIESLVGVAVDAAAELTIDLRAASTGGVSYANHLAALGLPVLDGLGPIGGLDHSPQEYILASSIVPRTALLALLIARYAGWRAPVLSGESIQAFGAGLPDTS